MIIFEFLQYFATALQRGLYWESEAKAARSATKIEVFASAVQLKTSDLLETFVMHSWFSIKFDWNSGSHNFPNDDRSNWSIADKQLDSKIFSKNFSKNFSKISFFGILNLFWENFQVRLTSDHILDALFVSPVNPAGPVHHFDFKNRILRFVAFAIFPRFVDWDEKIRTIHNFVDLFVRTAGMLLKSTGVFKDYQNSPNFNFKFKNFQALRSSIFKKLFPNWLKFAVFEPVVNRRGWGMEEKRKGREGEGGVIRRRGKESEWWFMFFHFCGSAWKNFICSIRIFFN